MRLLRRSLRSLVILAITLETKAEMPQLILPTENKAILQARPNDFYMHVNRSFEGKSSKPWTAGAYGFVRNMKRLDKTNVIGTRFHEGVDIKPVRRTEKGIPLDPVVAVADGEVAYVNPKSKKSNYGKYIAIRHDWGEGPVVSLYAHLSTVEVEIGQRVKQGEQIGILGYTGAGINRKRAHLHFELNLMLSDEFEEWHRHFLGTGSGHGNYNGQNLVGLDVIDLMQKQKQDEVRSLKQYCTTLKPYYTVVVKASELESFAGRYPWLWYRGKRGYPSVEISFTSSGFPMKLRASAQKVQTPTLSSVFPALGFHQDRTLKRIEGRGQRAKLSDRGKRYLSLITSNFPLTTQN